MNTKKLDRIVEKVDDIFHKEGYVLDHFELSKALFGVIKKRYHGEELTLYIGLRKFTGRGVPFI